MNVKMQASVSGLEAGTSYGLTIKASKTGGVPVFIGEGDQVADEEGRVAFTLEPMILQAVGRIGVPCTVEVWVRAGGSVVSSPPVKPSAKASIPVT
jgi:hypothetical protein